ncbi:MAG: acyl-CoA reductase [Flavobacteriia bacterium]|nr:acyl-CoA reductase [Flavobacteriia bacterium]
MSVYADRFKAVVSLGTLWREFVAIQKLNSPLSDSFQSLEDQLVLAGHKNGWFTRENVLFAMEQWGALLTETTLKNWLGQYPKANKQPTVFIIMAGNIPLVGMHDFLTAYLAGAKMVIKAASNDLALMNWVLNFLKEQAPSSAADIQIVEAYKGDYDGLIATGSDNTARYFEHYFGHKPHIIRKNRNSVAILTGQESAEDLTGLGEDIFRYYGLGCRSISKIYVPRNYDFDILFKALFPFKDLIDYEKYSNNYDYNKAVYLMSLFKILDNGFLILKEDTSLSSPIGSLFFEYYSDLDTLESHLEGLSESIQCMVGPTSFPKAIPFGSTQKPSLTDYADGVDTMKFIQSL